MNEQVINDKLFELCKDTLDSITEREQSTVKPKHFIEHTDAAACNRQQHIDFNQDDIIRQQITIWGRYVLATLATGQSFKIGDLLGKYLNIHVEVPFNTKEMPTMKYAMMEVVALFQDNTITAPIAIRILIAGLQHTLHQQIAINGPDALIDDLLLSITNAISGITMPYNKAQVSLII